MRPNSFRLTYGHPWTRGLQFAFLGNMPGGRATYESGPTAKRCTLSTSLQWTYEKQKAGLYSPSGTNYAQVVSSVSLLSFVQNTHVFSISLWVKLANTTQRCAFFGNAGSNAQKGFFLAFENYGAPINATKALRFGSYAGSSTVVCEWKSSDNAITDTNWHHIFVTAYTDTDTYNKVRFYVDGVELSGSPTVGLYYTGFSSGDSTYDLFMGATNYSTGALLPMAASVADIMIWNRVLSSTDCARFCRSGQDEMLDGLIEPFGGQYFNHLTPESISSYTLVAGSGSFSLAGQSAGLRTSRILPATAGAFSQTGGAANFQITMPSGAGSFALSGQAVNFLKSLILPGGNGSYSLAGQAAGLMASRLLAAENGDYNLTGQDIALLRSLVLSGGNGAFSLSGTAANLLQSLLIGADAGAFSLVGSEASLLKSLIIPATSGGFSLNGQDVNFLKSLVVPVENGAFSLNGQDINFIKSLILPSENGTFTLAGYEAALLKSFSISAGNGEFSLSGSDASLLCSRSIPATSGRFALTGTAADLLTNRLLPCGNGSYALVGQDASLVFSPVGTYTLVAGSGCFNLTGQAADLLASRILACDPGSFSFVGQPVSLLRSLRLIAATGTFLLDGKEVQLIYTPVGTFQVFKGRIIGMVGSGGAKSRQIGGN